VDVEALECFVPVLAHGVLADPQLSGDGGGVESVGDQLQHVALAQG
jgi:hypothetical protein